jgi:hypothetical protein
MLAHQFVKSYLTICPYLFNTTELKISPPCPPYFMPMLAFSHHDFAVIIARGNHCGRYSWMGGPF